MKRPAIFFDRDGIIVAPINGEAPTSADQMELIPEIVPVLKKTKEKGYLIFVVSNQPDIALGLVDEKIKDQMEERFVGLLRDQNIEIDKIYYCRHDKNGSNPKYSFDCDCRKPKPGLLIQAKKEFEIDMERSFMVGDRASDVKAGQSAGTKTILFDPTNLQKSYLKEHRIKPDFEIDELWQILQII